MMQTKKHIPYMTEPKILRPNVILGGILFCTMVALDKTAFHEFPGAKADYVRATRNALVWQKEIQAELENPNLDEQAAIGPLANFAKYVPANIKSRDGTVFVRYSWEKGDAVVANSVDIKSAETSIGDVVSRFTSQDEESYILRHNIHTAAKFIDSHWHKGYKKLPDDFQPTPLHELQALAIALGPCIKPQPEVNRLGS